ncbi:hypothetical protein CLV47_11924 [Antricoccus suffuscus]|uniref:DUF3592 domain-containing protein n=1 Tax=Antricoccus suffuscus TaxID=1629062 RepID=A0A2T0ZSK5_9ACTN|nr:hypothetical protein [Antricoccus suffuscus]PRZ39078.1 hypothetical protein CLV47_11924 [Antricoccus suffuscus]
MSDRAFPSITPTSVGRSPTSLVRWGTGVLGLGLGLVVVATLAFGFFSRIDGNVETAGTIQVGYAADQASSNAKQASGYGIYQVEYSIDGNDHVGFIVGSFSVGQEIQIKAPADGSPYKRLALADSVTTKVLSWLFMPIGLVLVVVGAIWLTRGLITRSAQIRADVQRAYGLPVQAAPTAPPVPQRQVIPPPQRPPEDGNEPPKGFFTAPYDI